MQSDQSLFEKLGGESTLNATVDIFYDNVLADESINHFFSNTNMKWLRSKQKAFLSFAFGGAHNYTGNDLHSSHKHLRISEKDYYAVQAHLVDALKEVGIAPELIQEVVDNAAEAKEAIITA